jgi:hypothetical protein
VLAVDGEPFSLYDNQQVVPRLQEVLGATLNIVHVADQPDQQPTPNQLLRTVRTCGLAGELKPEQVRVASDLPPTEGVLQAAAELRPICSSLLPAATTCSAACFTAVSQPS